MKNSRFIYNAVAVLVAGILFVAYGCQKDNQGNRITYYKDKTATGYVFYKNYDAEIGSLVGPIRPASNLEIKISVWIPGSWTTLYEHIDYVYTDINGQYQFKLLKKINGKYVQRHNIEVICSTGTTIPSNIDLYSEGTLYRDKEYLIDTVFINPWTESVK